MAQGKKRLNIRVIGAAAAVVFGLAGAGLYGLRANRTKHPERFIAAGDEAARARDFDQAAVNYQRAADMLPLDPVIHLKLGKAYYQIRYSNRDNFRNAVAEFTRAEELDPTSKDAWGALLAANMDFVSNAEAAPANIRDRERLPNSFSLARDAADHLVKLDPNNLEARIATSSLRVRAWLLKLTIPPTAAELNAPPENQKTDDQKVDDAIADLTKLLPQHPENELIPYWIARAKIYQAANLLQMDPKSPDAPPLYAEAAGEFDNSISEQPKNVNLYLKKVEILELLQRTDLSANTRAGYLQQKRQALDTAQSLVDIKIPDQYLVAKVGWALFLASTDPPRAEEVYRDLINRFSNLPRYQLSVLQLRIELADLLRRDYSREAEALAMLDAIPSLPPADIGGYDQQQGWAERVGRAKLERVVIETDQLNRRPIGKKYDDLVTDIKASLAIAEPRLGTSIEFLQARGRFELVSGHARDAIQTLTVAADKSVEQTGSVRPELLRYEADAYQQGHQTSRAIELLEKAMKDDPQTANSADVHEKLVNLHLENRDYAGAKVYVDWLALRLPNDPRVVILQIACLGPNPDLAAAKPLYDKLPEDTSPAIARKLGIARAALKSQPEAMRLLKMLNRADPANVQVAGELMQNEIAVGDQPGAQSVLDGLKKANPADPAIPVLMSLADGAKPKELFDAQLDELNKIPEPGMREQRIADLYENFGQPAEELKHLKAALSYSPDDTGLLQRIFLRQISVQQFAESEAMLPHLSELDADSAHGLMLKTKLCLAKGDIPTAVVVGRQLTHDFSEFSGSWELYGEALAAAGQLEPACQQFLAALDKQAANVDATKGLINCSVQLGKLADAKRYIAKARERFPDDPTYREMEVDFEINYGNPETVVPSLEQAVKDHPDFGKNYAILAQALLASSHAAANRSDGDAANQYLTRAKEVFKKAIVRWPDDLHFAQGLSQVCQQGGDFANAEAPLKAISDRPHWKNQPAPQLLLAKVYMAEHKLDLAEPLLKSALDENANFVEARVSLADCQIAGRQYEDALRTLKPGCDQYAVREKYVNLLLALSRGSEAEDMVVGALKTDEKNPNLINLLIDVYQSEHKSQLALERANQAIADDPSNINAYELRGELEASGVNADLETAKKDLQVYCDAMPTDARGRILLAEVLDATQDHDGAINQLQIAVRYGTLARESRLMLLRDYLVASPPRSSDAERLLSETLAIPQFQHDTQFEMAAAKLWAQRGDTDRALVAVRDVMDHVQDKSSLLNDYLAILFMAKKYSLLLDESKAYASDPKTSWPVFCYRAQAKAKSDDKQGAADEFKIALDKAGAEKDTRSARTVADAIAGQLGIDQALALVAPRVKNSAVWTVVSIGLYDRSKNDNAALAAAESAMNSFDSLDPIDQDYLLGAASSLYIRSKPPQTEKALAIYHKMVDRNPNDVNAMNNIASVLSDMTVPARPKDALVWSQKAYDQCKLNHQMAPAIYDTHGWILIQCDRLDDGIEVLHEAIDKSDFPDAHYHLAMGYLAEKHPEDAKRELQFAFEMLAAPQQTFTVIDPQLKVKIDAASKEADQMIQASTDAKPPA